MIDGRLSSGEWIAQYESVYRITAVPPSWHQRMAAACLAAGPSAVASHRCAGALWKLDGFAEPPLEVTVPGSGRRLIPGVIVHRTSSLGVADRTEIDGIPVTKVARTLIDLAAVVDDDQLEAAVDSALREGLASVPNLRRRLTALGANGRAGRGRLTRLLDDRARGRPSESVGELRAERLLVAAGLPLPERQYVLLDNGLFVARFDFAYPEARIGAEYDSYRHHFGRQAWARDHGRHNRATALGWLVFHLTPGHPGDAEQVARAHSARMRAVG